MTSAAPKGGLRRFLLSGSGWPYLLVPFIPVAVVLELTHASATIVYITSAHGDIQTAALMGRATEELAAQLEGLGLGNLGLGGGGTGGGGADQENLERYSQCIQEAAGNSDEVRKCADLLTTP